LSAFRLCVLASGAGTNLQAIMDRLHGREGIEVAGVASNNPGARALERAAEAGIETAVFPREDHPDRETRDGALGVWLEERGADLVVLAGYMELLTPGLVERFRDRIVNVHPALLPAFPGLDAVGQALAHGVRVTGVTVHFVDEGVDSGPIIMQRAVEILPGEDRGALEERIHAAEHELFPLAIEAIAAGAVQIDPEKPRVVRIDSVAPGEKERDVERSD
jgi:phosphoribosylglycinamide formyltransferase 1